MLIYALLTSIRIEINTKKNILNIRIGIGFLK